MTKLPDLSKLNLSEKERSEVEVILRELASRGRSDAYESLLKIHYEEIPVDIDEFIESDEYLGKSTNNGKGIYPYWRQTLREIFHGGKSYTEVIFSGAIGLGKTYIGCIIGCYLLYKLLCLKSPQSYYNLGANSSITFAFFNIHKYLSLDVAYGQFQKLLMDSPWFLAHGEIRGIKNKEYYPDKNIEFMVGCNEDHAIGKNIFFGLLDEMSFAKNSNPDILKSGVMKLYRSVKTRMTSRFTQGGQLLAKMILISSKRTDSDFLDQYAEKQKGDPDTYLVDEPQWVVKPKGTFSDRTFRIAVGSKTKKSEIIDDSVRMSDDDLLLAGYTRVLHVPLDLKGRFEFDMDANLRDLAGVSTTVFTKFISYDKLKRCYTSAFKNPFNDPQPVIGLDDQTQLIDYFDLNAVPDWVKQLPIYIHLDIAYAGDGYGIGAVAVAGTKSHYKIQTGEQATDPVYIHVFSASIKSPKGDQVSLEKVRQFIYWLRFTHNWNIKRVSTDGFMSVDTRQAMITRGIDADLLSLDKSPDGYLTLRTAIYEKRIAMLEIPLVETELINLERNEMSGKVDHPIDGSKDAADCIAGATWNASKHIEEYSPISESVSMFLDANENNAQSVEEKSTADLEEQLMNIARSKRQVDESQNIITDDDTMDDIIKKVTGTFNQSDNEPVSEYEKDFYASQGILF